MVALSKRFAFRVRFGSIDILNLRVRGHDTQTYLQTLAKVRQVLQHCKIDLTSGAVHQKQQNVGASDTRHNLLPLPHRNLRTTTIRSSGVHLLSRWLHPLDFMRYEDWHCNLFFTPINATTPRCICEHDCQPGE